MRTPTNRFRPLAWWGAYLLTAGVCAAPVSSTVPVIVILRVDREACKTVPAASEPPIRPSPLDLNANFTYN